MSWAVDTCIIIDALDDKSEHSEASILLLNSMPPGKLVLCPVSFVELAPSFLGDVALQRRFLDSIGVAYEEYWIRDDTLCAHAAWHRHVAARRAGKAPKRPLPDILIGAFAMRHEGLITRNPSDFADIFPSLAIRVP